MKTSNVSNWLALILCSLLLTWTPAQAPGQSREPEMFDVQMPAPRVRRRVPKQRSRVTNYQADRARQALMHSRPQPTRRYLPKHERLASAEVPIDPIPRTADFGDSALADELSSMSRAVPNAPDYETYDEGFSDPYYDEGWAEEPWRDGGSCDGGSCDCDSCNSSCGCGCGGGCTDEFQDMSGYPFGYLWGMGNLEVFGGLQGFVGPYNQGDSGSFGFQEGFNFGTVLPLFPYSGIGWQIGSRFAQSNLSGADFTDNQRNQTFFTTGFFKRRCGLQGGLVVDVLQDDWFSQANVNQLRGELSFRYPRIHEFGFRFTAHTGDDEVASPLVNGQLDTFEPINLYSFFYRRRLTWAPGGITTIFVGGSSDSDGYIGADAHLPFSDFLSLRSSFAYLIPDEPTNAGGTENEAWNVSIMLVFNLRGVRPGCEQSVFTPLLDVADNGNMIMDLVRSR